MTAAERLCALADEGNIALEEAMPDRRDLARWAADAAEYIYDIGCYLSSLSDPSPAVAQAEDLLARLAKIILSEQPS